MVPLIVMGSAPCAKEDYEKAISMIESDYDILGVGIDYCKVDKPIKYFATYHTKDLPSMQDKFCTIICHRQYNNMVDIVRGIDVRKEPSGSSALLGTLVAIDQGYSKIILCGCPLEGKNIKEQPYKMFWGGWRYHYEGVKWFVRSMSGWTMRLLGEPTKLWVNDK
jgi:hypothetical protein